MWTAGAYLAVHLIEGYLAAPLIEHNLGLVIVEIIFGTGGVILAAPITVVVYVLVKMLYVDNPLEQEQSK
jgi:predicted PurR-regulated permease PerM